MFGCMASKRAHSHVLLPGQFQDEPRQKRRPRCYMRSVRIRGLRSAALHVGVPPPHMPGVLHHVRTYVSLRLSWSPFRLCDACHWLLAFGTPSLRLRQACIPAKAGAPLPQGSRCTGGTAAHCLMLFSHGGPPCVQGQATRNLFVALQPLFPAATRRLSGEEVCGQRWKTGNEGELQALRPWSPQCVGPRLALLRVRLPPPRGQGGV